MAFVTRNSFITERMGFYASNYATPTTANGTPDTLFDGEYTAYYNPYSSGGAIIMGAGFNAPTAINKIRIYGYSQSGNYCPYHFKVMAGDTKTNMVKVPILQYNKSVKAYSADEAEVISFSNGDYIEITIPTTSKKYIGIYVGDYYGSGWLTFPVNELQFGYDINLDFKFIIKNSDDAYLKYNANTSAFEDCEAEPGESDFAPMDHISKVKDNLSSFTPEFDIVVLRKTVSDYKPHVTMEAVPTTRLVQANSDILLNSILNINSITLLTDNAKCIVSVDSGTTWNTWNGEWILIEPNDVESIKARGMTKAIISTRLKQDWENLINGSKKIRFAYLLDIANLTDSNKVDNIAFNVNMRGAWRRAKEADYDYAYADTYALRVEIMSTGDFKINY